MVFNSPCLTDKKELIHHEEFMKVAAFGVHAVNFLMLLQRFSPTIIRFRIQEVWSWYVVPTGKDNVIVSPGRAKVIPAGTTILVLEVIILISLASLRIEDLSRAGPTIFMDFIDGLPMSKGRTTLMVVVDTLSKYGHFILLTHPYTTLLVAQAFLDNVYKLHGLPKVIVSDRDTVFLRKFWCLECYLRYMSRDKPHEWVQWVPLAEYCGQGINTKGKFIQLLKFHLKRAEERMKTMVDMHRTERVFGIGDLVLLKLQPYREFTLRQHKHYKLAPKYYGPFKVLERIGQVAYKLDLPASSQIHLVFHVSQLKKFKGDSPQFPIMLPQCGSQGLIEMAPFAVLDRRMAKRGNAIDVYVLVQWVNGSPADAIWELYEDIAMKFPDFDLDA
ncbi:retrotransposable element Tf2 [Tanacetum coccineum]